MARAQADFANIRDMCIWRTINFLIKTGGHNPRFWFSMTLPDLSVLRMLGLDLNMTTYVILVCDCALFVGHRSLTKILAIRPVCPHG